MDKLIIAKKALEKLNSKGFQAYLVGGFVRDLLLNRATTDIDIATNAKPENVFRIFDHVIPTGLKHGTVTVIFDRLPIEVTTFRKEGKYTDYRHPSEVQFVDDLEDDLARRDFTMNAIALDFSGNLIDPFHGQIAIQEQKIQSVGTPTERFLEDPLRMMRAVRFAAQLNFRIETATYQAIKELADYLQYIAVERIKVELDKVMSSGYPEIGIEHLFHLGLFQWIQGGIGEPFLTLDLTSIKQRIAKTTDPILRWAILLYSLKPDQRESIMTGLRFSNKEKQTYSNIFTAYSIISDEKNIEKFKKCLIETNDHSCHKALELQLLFGKIDQSHKQQNAEILSELVNQMTVWNRKDLRITGKDLLEVISSPAGPWVKEYLDRLLDEVIYRDLPNTKQALVKRARQFKGENGDA